MANIHFHKITTNKDMGMLLDLEKHLVSSSPYYYATPNMDDLKKYIHNNVVYLIFDGSKPIGHLEYEIKNKDLAEITGIALLSEYRGKGIGKEALNKALEDLKDYKKLFLMTNPENNASVMVYLSAGFKIKSWHDNFYNNNQPRIRMELNK